MKKISVVILVLLLALILTSCQGLVGQSQLFSYVKYRIYTNSLNSAYFESVYYVDDYEESMNFVIFDDYYYIKDNICIYSTTGESIRADSVMKIEEVLK